MGDPLELRDLGNATVRRQGVIPKQQNGGLDTRDEQVEDLSGCTGGLS